MRVLIATVTAGAGHLQAASALEEAWRAMRPRDSVEKLDVLDFTSRLYRKLYIESYVALVEHAPELWAHVFKRTDDPERIRKLARLRRAWSQITTSRFVTHLQKLRPEVMICTHYMPSEIISAVKDEMKRPPFTSTVVTDFEAHALWMQPGVDLYFVAAEETKARLVARGLSKERVVVTGIPVSGRFANVGDRAEIRKCLGLRDDLPVLLVLGGGFGMGPVEEILHELNKVSILMQVMVVCGRNEELRREVAVIDCKHPTRVYGFVTNMQELMAASDLVITKPGGLTSSEALALGKPIFVLNPIPGQEAANSDFLLEYGAATKANRLEDLPFRLEKLLGSSKLDEMARIAAQLGRPHAARDICKEILRRVNEPEIPKPKRQIPEKSQTSGFQDAAPTR
ncbi:MAG: glycosyltransferase [Verrucomicrobia subdivision 3 bacterium]|nr:glycosyltransferase [Limisphaerales bacterium]